jgi:tol-pal system protein YbgF
MEIRRGARWALVFPTALALTGCVTAAEYRKLERDVMDLKRGGAPGAEGGNRLADLAAQLDDVRHAITSLEGRLEVAEHDAQRALEEARAARVDAAGAAGATAGGGSAPVTSSEPDAVEGVGGAQVAAYRQAYAAWRTGDPQACIDQFREFLQTYADSPYADDAAYWMAECYFKDGDYKTAVLRFDDVAARYPTGNKAADALYRQGEALLRLGPGYGKAAGKAFERVLREYPDSARAPEAKRRLDLLGSG